MNLIRKGLGFTIGLMMLITVINLSRGIPDWKRVSVIENKNAVIAELSDATTKDDWKGEDVIKLALDASKGKYILVVDGIQIDSEDDLEATNLRNMIGAVYDVKSYTDTNLSKKVIVANIR